MRTFKHVLIILLIAPIFGCATSNGGQMEAVLNVDIDRFMGRWYVIASIPTFAERGALNPTENYQLNQDGTVATTFTYDTGKPGESTKTLKMTAFVNKSPANGIWRMQWIWPFKADYRIAYLDQGYQQAIIGRNKRDYLWIMSRTQGIEQSELEALLNRATSLGYPREDIQISNWQKFPKDAS